jgi:hypothetical protein
MLLQSQLNVYRRPTHYNNKKSVAGEVSSQDAPQLAHSPFTFLTTKIGGLRG